jgi:sigma-B regulation protein RsbU (phosphoserine phosphatase)
MEEFWGPNSDLPLPYEAWPTCLSELGREPGVTKSLAEWRRGSQKRDEAARAVQSLIVRPKLEVKAGRYKIWCWSRSAENVGGDYYHVKKVSNEKCRVYIGDAFGIGLPAALLVQQIHGVITALEEQIESAGEICGRLNKQLYEQAHGEDQQLIDGGSTTQQWASLISATLDTKSNRLTVSNAGHPFPIIVRKDASDCELIADGSPSPAVGQYADSVYSDYGVNLASGDRLVFYTDGVSEALGDELLTCILENRKLGAAKLGEALVSRLRKKKSQDDQTLIVIALD